MFHLLINLFISFCCSLYVIIFWNLGHAEVFGVLDSSSLPWASCQAAVSNEAKYSLPRGFLQQAISLEEKSTSAEDYHVRIQTLCSIPTNAEILHVVSKRLHHPAQLSNPLSPQASCFEAIYHDYVEPRQVIWHLSSHSCCVPFNEA